MLHCCLPTHAQDAPVANDAAMLIAAVYKSNRDWIRLTPEFWSIAHPYAREGRITKQNLARLKELYGIASKAAEQSEKLIRVLKVGSHISDYPGILACGKIVYFAERRVYRISLHGGFAGEEDDTTWQHWIWITEKGVIDSKGKSPMPSQ